MDRTLADAGIGLADVTALAVTVGPGLVGSLLVGVSVAKALAYARRLPLIAVNHLEGHIAAARLEFPSLMHPFLALVVSGGHTHLYHVPSECAYRLLGRTRDDAAGEAFDKVANILRLGYPGGPAIDRAAAGGNPRAAEFPRSWLEADSADFSFSGLKTAVLYHCLGTNPSRDDIESARYEEQFVADVAASFQEAVVDVLAAKALAAVERHAAASLIVGGGVAANSRLRDRFTREAGERGLELHLAPREFCTDNAAMTAGLGYHLLRAGRVASLDTEAVP